jgi:chromosome segregation ATPase
MNCIHRSLLAAAVLICASAASISAQTAPAPDSAKVAKLATVTVTAQGNWFTRADDLRNSIIDAMAENRRLEGELLKQDAQIQQLSTRLDSLKRIEFVQKVKIAAIDDSVAATRARRRALEARVVALEPRSPQP